MRSESDLSEKKEQLVGDEFFIDGIKFTVQTEKPSSLDYVRRTMLVATQEPTSSPEMEVSITGIGYDQGLKVIEESKESGKIKNGWEEGVLKNNGRYVKTNNYIHITYQIDEDHWKHISAGNEPEMGICAFMRTHLLHKVAKEMENFAVIHAASITDAATGKSVIILGDNDEYDARNKGKTSTALYSCLRKHSRFSLSSDNEVSLGLQAGKVVFKTLPNEILMRERLLLELRRDGLSFDLEPWTGVDRKNNEKIFTTSASFLSRAGVSFSPLMDVSGIVFVALDSDHDGIKVTRISPDVAQRKAVHSIHPMRMRQLSHPVWLNETDIGRGGIPSDAVNIGKTWSHLNKNIGLWTVSGGINKDDLYKAMCDIIDS